jgi:hypothetical protein
MEQSTETQRFIFIAKNIIEKKWVKSINQFAKEINYPQSVISEIIAGKKNVTNTIILNLCKRYALINRNYLLDGTGEPFLTQYNPTETPAVVSETDGTYNTAPLTREKLQQWLNEAAATSGQTAPVVTNEYFNTFVANFAQAAKQLQNNYLPPDYMELKKEVNRIARQQKVGIESRLQLTDKLTEALKDIEALKKQVYGNAK